MICSMPLAALTTHVRPAPTTSRPLSEGWLTPADLLCVLDDTYTFDVIVDAERQLQAARWAGGGSDAAPWLHGGGGGDKGGGGGTAAVDAQTSFQNGLAIGTLFALLAAACLRALMILRHRKRMAHRGLPVETSGGFGAGRVI